MTRARVAGLARLKIDGMTSCRRGLSARYVDVCTVMIGRGVGGYGLWGSLCCGRWICRCGRSIKGLDGLGGGFVGGRGARCFWYFLVVFIPWVGRLLTCCRCVDVGFPETQRRDSSDDG